MPITLEWFEFSLFLGLVVSALSGISVIVLMATLDGLKRVLRKWLEIH